MYCNTKGGMNTLKIYGCTGNWTSDPCNSSKELYQWATQADIHGPTTTVIIQYCTGHDNPIFKCYFNLLTFHIQLIWVSCSPQHQHDDCWLYKAESEPELKRDYYLHIIYYLQNFICIRIFSTFTLYVNSSEIALWFNYSRFK